jgi:sulfide:quinone oxidoreductase
MTRTLILGGGFGGLTVATELRERLGREHEIVLVDRRERFYVGLRKLWVMAGIATLEEGTRPLAALEQRGIRFVHAVVGGIDAKARRVETDAGALDGDFLVIALGAEPRADLAPGLSQHGVDLFDVASVETLAQRVAAFDHGAVGVVIAGLPYKCPPAPYEATLLLEDTFRRRGVRDRVALAFTTLQPALLPNAGPPGHARMVQEFTRRGVTYHVGRAVRAFERGRVVFEDGELPLDLAIGVPPHRPPAVVRESGLTGDGDWIPVDPRTLATRFPGVYAIGDVVHIPLANQTALPKAGVFAEAHGKLVAAAIVARVLGGPQPPPFDGRGYCWLETGHDQAARIEGDFFAMPAPRVELQEASAAQAAEKRRFEAERLTRWFGE